MSDWIKQNLVLVSGIVLPVLLVGAFFVLSTAPRVLAEPPGYDFLLVGYRYDYQNPANYALTFEVRNNHLTGRAVPRGRNAARFNRQYAAVFRYNAAADTFEELPFDLPEGLDDIEEAVDLPLAEIGELSLDKRLQSPDGYRYEYMGYRGRGGLLGELFGMRRRHESNYVLKKDNAYFDLPSPASHPYYQNDLHFMGWVIEEGASP